MLCDWLLEETGAADDVGADGVDGANEDVPVAVDCVDAICDNGVSVFCKNEQKEEKKLIKLYLFAVWLDLYIRFLMAKLSKREFPS